MKRIFWFVLPVLILEAIFIGTQYFSGQNYSEGAYKASPDDPAINVELDQGWDDESRAFWYEATQGSRLLPLEWMEALEQRGSTALFMDPDHVESHNFIPRRVHVPDRENLAQLTLGMALNNQSDLNFSRTQLRWKPNQTDKEYWAGFTCSACHTSRITYKGQEMRVDGGGSLMNFQSFMYEFNLALEETYIEKAKWDRFASKILVDAEAKAEYGDKLRTEFKKVLDWQKREASSNFTFVKYGYGRIDAFGHIYNKIALLLKDGDQEFNQPDAPVSIPFIWSAPQYNKVQYNGAAPRVYFWGVDVGALARNMGEFIGVFGDVTVEKKIDKDGFASSVDLKNLYSLEKSTEHMRSPKWPTKIFGPHDEEEKKNEAKLVARGEDLYQQNCLLCHDVVDRTDTKRDIVVQENYLASSAKIAEERLQYLPKNLHNQRIEKLSTDPWMACNAYSATLRTGLWSSDRAVASNVDFKSIERGDPVALGEKIEASKLLSLTVAGILAANQSNVTELIGTSFLSAPSIPRGIGGIDDDASVVELGSEWQNYDRKTDKAKRLEDCLRVCLLLSGHDVRNNYLGYTSRPLNGIWATAPFLHNGSVPTLYDLLLPADQRPNWFWTGSYEYDPVKVGFITNKTEANRFLFEARNSTGGALNSVDGNTNRGHDYGNEKFSDEDRMALIAYLKTL
ncbi:MAG: di-heme-cytochrome C peroxidase [Hyphomicrobiales bacterium]